MVFQSGSDWTTDDSVGVNEAVARARLADAVAEHEIDLASLQSVRSGAGRIIADGRPFDLVIANAGISGSPAPAAMIEEAAWQTMLDINITLIREGFLKYFWAGAIIGIVLRAHQKLYGRR